MRVTGKKGRPVALLSLATTDVPVPAFLVQLSLGPQDFPPPSAPDQGQGSVLESLGIGPGCPVGVLKGYARQYACEPPVLHAAEAPPPKKPPAWLVDQRPY